MTKTSATDSAAQAPAEGATTEPTGSAVFRSKPVKAVLVLGLLWVFIGRVPPLLRDTPAPPSAQLSEARGADAAEAQASASPLEAETKTREELAQPLEPELDRTPRGPIAKPDGNGFVAPRMDDDHAPLPIVDSAGSLAPFYRALARTEKGEASAVTRISFHGDSLIASDYVSATLRRKFQKKFGDSGHGFVLMADPWPAYFHNDVFRFTSKGFNVRRIVGPYSSDGLYGFGGVSFEAPPGVRARFGTVESGDFGRNVSRFRLFYLRQPHGGQLQVNVDGQLHSTVDTRAVAKAGGVHDVAVSDGPHLFEVVTKSSMTRTFGVVLERDRPGVVLDAVGIQGARIRFLDKQDDAHWAEQLRFRGPDLLVYLFGANESIDGVAYSMEEYHDTMKAVLLQAKAAVPNAGCLVLAAMDRARLEGQAVVTVPIIPSLVEVQEATAREVGCAFWNTYQAMGGKGSMAKWVLKGLGQADMTHPSGYGSEVLGNWIFQALMAGYRDHQGSTP
jgi:hypothetical protein